MWRLLRKWRAGTALLLFLSCDETLPPRVLTDFLEPVFQGGDSVEIKIPIDRTFVLGEGFVVGLRNRSDEILEAPSRVRGKVELWSLDDSTFRRTMVFEETFFDSITIMPETTFTVRVVWDLRDDSCRYAYRMIQRFLPEKIGVYTWYRGEQLLRFRARGTIQMFPNVETKDLPEVEFSRWYLFQETEPQRSFLDRANCDGL